MGDSGTADVEQSSVFVTAPDGLKLHVRCYGPRLAPSLPVVCLPGLTRTAADFDDLACRAWRLIWMPRAWCSQSTIAAAACPIMTAVLPTTASAPNSPTFELC